MSYRSIRTGAGFALALLTAAPALAQVPLTPRALGMGGAYVAVARGQETIFLNPANLGLGDSPHWSVALPQFAISGSFFGPTFGDFRDLLNYDDLEEARKTEIFETIPSQGTEIRYDVRAPVFALQTGRFGFGVSYGSIGQHTVGQDVVELLLFGYEEGRTDYAVGDTRGSRMTFWDFAASYGRSFGPLSLGVTGHYMHGGSLVRSRLFEPRINIEAEDFEIEYRSVLARGGSGYGVDFGVALQPTPALTVSAAINNVYSQMEWSETLRTRFLILTKNDIENESGANLLTRYEKSEAEVDPESAPQTVYTTAEGLYDETVFPAIGRVGVAWQIGTATQIAAEYQDRLTEGRLSSHWERQAGLGVQHSFSFLAVRAGAASNLDGSSLLSGGLSIGPLQLGLAHLNEGQTDGFDRTGWVGTFGVSVRTRGTMR